MSHCRQSLFPGVHASKKLTLFCASSQSRSDASSAFTVIHHQSPSTTAATAADSLIIEDVTAEFESAAVATNEEAAADTLGIADVTAQIESTAFAFMQEVTADEGTSSAGEDTPDEDSSDEGVAI